MGQMKSMATSDGKRVDVYVVQPSGPARGAVVVVPEIFGLNSHIRSVADGYAVAGYVAVAPATFQRVAPGLELGYTEADMTEGLAHKTAVEALPAPGVLADLQAAVDEAARLSGGKVGMVGYCWGGLLTWRSACELTGLAAAVSYYGGGMTTEAEMARQPRCPVLAHFAEQDHWIPLEGVAAFRRSHPTVEVHTYPANHGFNCDQRGAYDAPSAQLARDRTLAFFSQHLAG